MGRSNVGVDPSRSWNEALISSTVVGPPCPRPWRFEHPRPPEGSGGLSRPYGSRSRCRSDDVDVCLCTPRGQVIWAISRPEDGRGSGATEVLVRVSGPVRRRRRRPQGRRRRGLPGDDGSNSTLCGGLYCITFFCGVETPQEGFLVYWGQISTSFVVCSGLVPCKMLYRLVMISFHSSSTFCFLLTLTVFSLFWFLYTDDSSYNIRTTLDLVFFR